MNGPPANFDPRAERRGEISMPPAFSDSCMVGRIAARLMEEVNHDEPGAE